MATKLRPSQAEWNAKCERVARWYLRKGDRFMAAHALRLKVKARE